MNRRTFLQLLTAAGATASGLVLPEIEPVRRIWQVPAKAPVRGSRFYWYATPYREGDIAAVDYAPSGFEDATVLVTQDPNPAQNGVWPSREGHLYRAGDLGLVRYRPEGVYISGFSLDDAAAVLREGPPVQSATIMVVEGAITFESDDERRRFLDEIGDAFGVADKFVREPRS